MKKSTKKRGAPQRGGSARRPARRVVGSKAESSRGIASDEPGSKTGLGTKLQPRGRKLREPGSKASGSLDAQRKGKSGRR